MMKFHKPLLFAFTAGALLFAGNLLAQDVPVPATSTMQTQPTTIPAPDAAAYSTPQGELTVHSAPAPAPVIGPAPTFEQLSGGGKAITEDQAMAYLPLVNDFINADSNRNGSISKTEYARWTKQL